MGLRMSAAWGCAGAQQAAMQERSMGLRRGPGMGRCTGAAWGCAGA